jgi:hypothetical protein
MTMNHAHKSSLPKGTIDSGLRHRRDTMEYAASDGAYEAEMERWRHLFVGWNEKYYGNELTVPYIRLSAPASTKALGTYSPISGEGGRSEIKLRPSIYYGTYPGVRAGAEYADGRMRYLDDVLLHEIIHLWQKEGKDGKVELSYHWHGPTFRDKCNQIGQDLGLGRVGTKHQKKLPQCRYWPHVVRPEGYYLGALKGREAKDSVVTLVPALGPDENARRLQRRLEPDFLAQLTAALRASQVVGTVNRSDGAGS